MERGKEIWRGMERYGNMTKAIKRYHNINLSKLMQTTSRLREVEFLRVEHFEATHKMRNRAEN